MYDFLDHFYLVPAEQAKSQYTNRAALWDLYVSHCDKRRMPEMNQTDKSYTHQGAFGRLVVKRFPTIIGRRLGNRGNQKYYYEGLACREDSPYYDHWCINMRFSGPLKMTYTAKPDTQSTQFNQFLSYAEEYLEADSHGEISRLELYSHYLRVCKKSKWDSMSQIAFGRAMKQVFKSTRVRRLNAIHCQRSDYTFEGIAYRSRSTSESRAKNDMHCQLWALLKKDLRLEGRLAKYVTKAQRGKGEQSAPTESPVGSESEPRQ